MLYREVLTEVLGEKEREKEKECVCVCVFTSASVAVLGSLICVACIPILNESKEHVMSWMRIKYKQDDILAVYKDII